MRTDHIVNVLPSDAFLESERVQSYLRAFAKRNPEAFREISRNELQSKRLRVLFSSSRFLSEEILRHPSWFPAAEEFERALSVEDYRARLAVFLLELQAAPLTALELALFRRRELIRIVVRDRMQLASLSEITQELSNLADALLGNALEEVNRELQERFGVPIETASENPGKPAVFTVIALGKLGGQELNYSSDIDLMFLYSANGQTSGAHPVSNKEFFKKVANGLTAMLSSYTGAGQCYRLDLRLRPEGTHGEVCISASAARHYYAKRARDWELQMLLKARVAAGDEAVGRSLLDAVEPLIYSTTLDFSTIESMSATRERIGEKVARKRARPATIDVKLTPGGIRDVEFLVQCLQRLHGARENRVRHRGTLLAISRLEDNHLLSASEAERLAEAYQFLRRVEHALQFEDDRQTHALPTNVLELQSVANRILCSEETAAAADQSARLLRELNQHLENVLTVYERIVHAQRPLYYAYSAAAPDQEETSMSAARALPHPASGSGLMDFVEALPERGVERKMIAANAKLRSWVAQIFESAPLLAAQLNRQPELLLQMQEASEDPGRRYAFEGLAPPLNDVAGLQALFRAEMFRIQCAGVCLPEPIFRTLDQTSALAEFVIARAYRVALEMSLAYARSHALVEKPFEEPQAEMMVVALGRLGMREFDVRSDADLLFIIPDEEANRHRFWTRVVERLLDVLSTYGGDGPTLSIDTRLRPNGREGMLVQTESKYVDYFSGKAEAWEGIAYMKARAVAGDTDRATKFLVELQQVDWRRYGQSGRSKHDLRQMRLRLQKEQGASAPLKAEYGGYYDADFILMYLRLRGAGMFFKSLNTPERIDVVEKMGHLERADAEFLLAAATHFRALDHAIRLVTGHAEGKLPASHEHRETIASLVGRWTAKRAQAETLETDLLALQSKMHRLFERVFAE